MKINSVKNAGPVRSSLSVDAIDDEDDKKQISIPVPGYKRKQAKLVYKYNMFVQKYQQKHDEGEHGIEATTSRDDSKEVRGKKFDPFEQVSFADDIPEEQRKNVQWFLDELNKYNDDPDSSKRVFLNNKNIDEFLTILQELWHNDLYFGRERERPSDGERGNIVDFRA